MSNRFVSLAAVGAVLFSSVALLGSAPAAQAQGSTCQRLWYERNEIYARNGYCFKTARARATFGEGCFPPFGRLSYAEKRRVDEIQAEENAMGCPR